MGDVIVDAAVTYQFMNHEEYCMQESWHGDALSWEPLVCKKIFGHHNVISYICEFLFFK
jgi:hypothetical protein